MEQEEASIQQRLVWAVLILVTAGLVGAALYKKALRPPDAIPPGAAVAQVAPPGGEAEPPGPVGNFSFTDQNGQTVTAGDLQGRVWVADFIYSRCAVNCMAMTNSMLVLNKELSDEKEIRLVSFTLDPGFDTPEVLLKYAQRHGAESPRWRFLTGPQADLHRLTRDAFKLVVDTEKGTPAEPILHSEKLVLVDQAGVIRGYYNGTDAGKVKELIADARKLLSEPAEPQPGAAKAN